MAAVGVTFSEPATADSFHSHHPSTEATMRSLLLLFLGIPIPIIILIALFVH
jgi:hypothetical protein